MMTKTEYPGIGETLYSGTLENGLSVRVIPKPGFSSVYALFGTHYGGAMRRFELDGETIDTPAGVAHFLEHKMFDMPDGENALSTLSANGANPNAFTSSGVTCYYFSCTNAFYDNLKMLLHFVSTPYFTAETVQKEQGIIGQEIQMGIDSPGSSLYYNLLGLLYDHHPIRDKIEGSIESIAEITADTLYHCHKVFYAPSNMVLCVEGDVDPEEVFRIASEELCSEYQSVPHADYGELETLFPAEKEKSVEMEVSAPQFLIGSKICPNPSIRERLTGTLALTLLVGPSSPFYAKLYDEGTLNRDFDFEVDYSAGTGTVIIGGESKNPEKVLSEFNAEVKKITESGFDDACFSRALRASIGGKLRSLEDFENTCVSLGCCIFDGYNFFDSFDEMQNITKHDCEQWIAENLCEEKLAISVVRPNK